MRKKIFTFLLALAASVGMMNAKVTWNSSNISDLNVMGTYHPYSKEGVTLSANSDMLDASWYNYGTESMKGIEFRTHETGGFTFSNTLGKNFTKIEMFPNGPAEWDMANLGSGWSFYWDPSENKPVTVTWTGNASTVDLLKEASDFHGGEPVKSIVFYFEGDSEAPDPTYTVALKAGTANANKVTLSATSAVEGATITVTPDDEYEITAFKAKYNTTEEAALTLDPATGAYSFTMPAYAVTIEATIALKPVPEGDIYAGFTATAGSGGFNNEGHANLVDNKFTSADWTKWCADNSYKSVPTGESGDACWWIDFEASEALNPTGYILTTGNDTGNEHGRNPKNWVLKAKLNAGDAWTTIATVTNDVTMKNKSFKDYKFFVDQSGTYQYFRFEVFANQGANVMQLCELRLIGAEPQLAVANTLQLHVNDAAMGSVALQDPSNDIFDFGDGTYAVPEGATVTLIATPNEGYEFIGWKASSSICDFNDCEFTALPTVANPLTVDMYQEAAFMAEFAAVAPAPQPQIGPKEVLDLGTTGCVGEHYQLTGGGISIYRTVGGVDDKMITIESLHGEIIDNISLKLYYYNVWTGYSVAASSGDVSSWNYDAYEDLVITNINATSVTLSRVGSGQANGYVMFEKVTINNSDEPQPQPAEDVEITPYVDPDHAGVYYSTFFDSSVKYELPAGVEAYVADLSGANLLLTKIAEAGEVIPANVAVILKASVDQFTLTVSDADAVTFTATNDLQGSDTQITTPGNCYVLAGTNGVGFYHYTASMLNPHKAYVIYSGSQAPGRMRFIFDQATGVESVQPSAISSQKVIENGQLFIIKNGVKYNAQGQVVK